MKVQFGERKEPWLEPDVEVDLEATQIDFDGDASGLAPPSSEALKSNSIPKMVAATKSSPIAQARTVVITPAIRAKTPSAAQTLPMDKSFSVATTVDDPEPASSRQSTEVGDEDVEESAATKNDLPVSVGPPPKAPGTIALRVPVATPAGPAPTIALKLPGTPPPARPPATIALKLPAASPPAGGGSQAAVAPPVSPASIESERSFARSVITDATAIVEPLAVVVARAQTVTQSRSRKMQYIGGGAAVVAAIILAIVLWPPSDHTTGSSAAPAARPEPETTPEPEVETPQKSALDMTARDYEAARSDAGVAAEVAPEVDDAAVAEAIAEVTADAAVADDAAAAEPAVVAVEPVVEPDAPAVKPAATAAKTPKRTTTKKTAAKRTKTQKATKKAAKKTAKPKWNPDDLFIGE
jgi:hypothetical protein